MNVFIGMSLFPFDTAKCMKKMKTHKKNNAFHSFFSLIFDICQLDVCAHNAKLT